MFAGESRSQAYTDFRVPRPLPSGGALVLGVVGGWERWDQDNRGVGRTAARLRGKLGDGVWVETVENHKLALGVRLINEAFATATNGRLLILGQSPGGSAAVRLARYCERRGIPVDLLITID